MSTRRSAAFEEYTCLRMQSMGPILPDGYGLMRVIPVESAIEGIPGVTDDERLSHYLDKYDVFSGFALLLPRFAHEPRRRLRPSRGGHVRAGWARARSTTYAPAARQITREEALEIVKRAEENGLMHDIPNIEGRARAPQSATAAPAPASACARG